MRPKELNPEGLSRVEIIKGKIFVVGRGRVLYVDSLETAAEIIGERLSRFHHPFTGFNIIEFDKHLQMRYGNYEDGKTSMSDFIEKKFGTGGVDLIKKLIEI